MASLDGRCYDELEFFSGNWLAQGHPQTDMTTAYTQTVMA